MTHARDCEYVTTDGPAPCTCGFVERDCAAADRDGALADLKRAVVFFDKVKVATQAEKNAVGTDHWDWLEKAARRVAATV